MGVEPLSLCHRSSHGVEHHRLPGAKRLYADQHPMPLDIVTPHPTASCCSLCQEQGLRECMGHSRPGPWWQSSLSCCTLEWQSAMYFATWELDLEGKRLLSHTAFRFW